MKIYCFRCLAHHNMNIKQLFHCFEGNIPECLGCPELPGRSEIIYNSGIPGTEEKRSGLFPEKQWNNCYVTFSLVKTLEKSIRNSRGNVTPADSRDVMSNVVVTIKCPSLVQSGVLSIPKFSPGNIMFAVPAVSGQYNAKQYLARLCICEVKTVQNILRGFL